MRIRTLFLLSARRFDRVADVTWIDDALSGYFENHVAFLEAVIRSCYIRIHASYDDAGFACTRH